MTGKLAQSEQAAEVLGDYNLDAVQKQLRLRALGWKMQDSWFSREGLGIAVDTPWGERLLCKAEGGSRMPSNTQMLKSIKEHIYQKDGFMDTYKNIIRNFSNLEYIANQYGKHEEFDLQGMAAIAVESQALVNKLADSDRGDKQEFIATYEKVLNNLTHIGAIARSLDRYEGVYWEGILDIVAETLVFVNTLVEQGNDGKL